MFLTKRQRAQAWRMKIAATASAAALTAATIAALAAMLFYL
jgi:hypothetical protein